MANRFDHPYLSDPKPFALVLLTFNDIPIDRLPGPQRYYNFVAASGSMDCSIIGWTFREATSPSRVPKPSAGSK